MYRMYVIFAFVNSCIIGKEKFVIDLNIVYIDKN